MYKSIPVLSLLAIGSFFISGCEDKGSPDSAAIKKNAAEYAQAFNQRDAAKLASLWTEDADYVNPMTGEHVEGRSAIEEYFKKRFEQNKDVKMDIHVKDIEFSDSNNATETGIAKLTSEEGVQQKAFKVDLAKEDGLWLLQSFNEVDWDVAPTNFEQLKELSWLVGKWHDDDENVNITFDYSWDKYKNFLTQHFDMKLYGQEGFEGKQIIAWDPIEEHVRSWVFDSDGGFGEGVWEKQGDTWYAKINYTLSDGSRATATNIYSKINDSTYTFAAINREVDGEVLPNIDPVKVVRQ